MKFKSSRNQKEAGDAGITVTIVCTLIGIAASIALASKKSYSQASVDVYGINSRSGYEKTEYWQSSADDEDDAYFADLGETEDQDPTPDYTKTEECGKLWLTNAKVLEEKGWKKEDGVKTETYPDDDEDACEDIATEGTKLRGVTECYEVMYDGEHLVKDYVKATVRDQPQHICFDEGGFVTKQTVSAALDEFVEDWYRGRFHRINGKAMGKIYYRPIRLDRDKIGLGKLVEKKTVNYRCSEDVKAWNTHTLHADSNGNPPPKELTQAGNDSTFTVEITYSAAEAGWNDYIKTRNRTDFKEYMELTSYKQDPAAVTHTLAGLKEWDSWTITSAPVLSGSATRKIKKVSIFSRKTKIEQRESVQTNPYVQYTP